jgi:hypothetical protein
MGIKMLLHPKVTQELKDAGVETFESINSNGEIIWLPEATQEDRDIAAAVLAAHDPTDYDAEYIVAAQERLNAADMNALKAAMGGTSDSALLVQVVSDLMTLLRIGHVRAEP